MPLPLETILEPKICSSPHPAFIISAETANSPAIRRGLPSPGAAWYQLMRPWHSLFQHPAIPQRKPNMASTSVLGSDDLSDSKDRLARLLLILCGGGLLFCALYYLAETLFNLFFHPLRQFPGPTLARISRLWSRIGNFQGCKSERIHQAHLQYGGHASFQSYIASKWSGADDVQALSYALGRTSCLSQTLPLCATSTLQINSSRMRSSM